MKNENLKLQIKRETVTSGLREIKERAQAIINRIDNVAEIENNENYDDYRKAMEVMHKAATIIDDVSHLSVKATNIIPNLTQLTFEIGRTFERNQ
jgi:hypothetical protein